MLGQDAVDLVGRPGRMRQLEGQRQADRAPGQKPLEGSVVALLRPARAEQHTAESIAEGGERLGEPRERSGCSDAGLMARTREWSSRPARLHRPAARRATRRRAGPWGRSGSAAGSAPASARRRRRLDADRRCCGARPPASGRVRRQELAAGSPGCVEAGRSRWIGEAARARVEPAATDGRIPATDGRIRRCWSRLEPRCRACAAQDRPLSQRAVDEHDAADDEGRPDDLEGLQSLAQEDEAEASTATTGRT